MRDRKCAHLRRQRGRLGHRRRHDRAAPRAGAPGGHRRPARRRRHRGPLDRRGAGGRGRGRARAHRGRARRRARRRHRRVHRHRPRARGLGELLRRRRAGRGAARADGRGRWCRCRVPGLQLDHRAARLGRRGRGRVPERRRGGGPGRRGAARGGHGLPGQQGGAGLVGPARRRDREVDRRRHPAQLRGARQDRDRDDRAARRRPGLRAAVGGLPDRDRTGRPGRGDRRPDRVPALRRRLAGRRLGAVRRRRHRRDPASHRPGGLGRDPARVP